MGARRRQASRGEGNIQRIWLLPPPPVAGSFRYLHRPRATPRPRSGPSWPCCSGCCCCCCGHAETNNSGTADARDGHDTILRRGPVPSSREPTRATHTPRRRRPTRAERTQALRGDRSTNPHKPPSTEGTRRPEFPAVPAAASPPCHGGGGARTLDGGLNTPCSGRGFDAPPYREDRLPPTPLLFLFLLLIIFLLYFFIRFIAHLYYLFDLPVRLVGEDVIVVVVVVVVAVEVVIAVEVVAGCDTCGGGGAKLALNGIHFSAVLAQSAPCCSPRSAERRMAHRTVGPLRDCSSAVIASSSFVREKEGGCTFAECVQVSPTRIRCRRFSDGLLLGKERTSSRGARPVTRAVKRHTSKFRSLVGRRLTMQYIGDLRSAS
jgi:hypothetical protein